ncbi:hypothetical protein BAL199_17313 [alpha proteobacterium BAL199]|jgi:hypothetical protein|nr:hypothetical protein BAL199_17313 [alpha proteobacterium BAL199]
MGLLGTGMLITFTEVAPQDEMDFNEWYNREHVDERVFMPGFKRARRYVAADSATKVKYFATYETDTVRDLCAPEYMKLLGNQSDWSKRVMAKFTHFDRLTLTCTVDLAHGISGAAGLARFFPADEHKPALRELLRDSLLPELGGRAGMHGAVLMENDLDVVAEGMRAQGKPVPADLKQEWVVILEGSTPAIVGAALAEGFDDDRLAEYELPTGKVDLGRYAFVFGNHR